MLDAKAMPVGRDRQFLKLLLKINFNKHNKLRNKKKP